MSILFTPKKLNQLQVKNRFIFSACEDNLPTEQGFANDAVIAKSRKIAKGDVGLIISGHIAVHPLGRTRKRQLGIYNDDMVAGLRKLVGVIHDHGSKILFQLGHSGAQTKSDVIGQQPFGPSSKDGKTGEMIEDQIYDAIFAFRDAATRAVLAGADGIQLHAAHGYLINQFLSPYFNHRQDLWGGSEENMFRFLKSIVTEIRKSIPEEMPLLIKLNSNDYTPEQGITPELSISYAKRLSEMNIDGIEVSCGTSMLSPWNMCRGDVPAKEIAARFPEPKRTAVESHLAGLSGKFGFQEEYNFNAATMMQMVARDVPVFPVGGFRNVSRMGELVSNGQTDFISMCRPFIRQPNLVKLIKDGKLEFVTCTSCNKCLAAIANNLPVKCYLKK